MQHLKNPHTKIHPLNEWYCAFDYDNKIFHTIYIAVEFVSTTTSIGKPQFHDHNLVHVGLHGELSDTMLK